MTNTNRHMMGDGAAMRLPPRAPIPISDADESILLSHIEQQRAPWHTRARSAYTDLMVMILTTGVTAATIAVLGIVVLWLYTIASRSM